MANFNCLYTSIVFICSADTKNIIALMSSAVVVFYFYGLFFMMGYYIYVLVKFLLFKLGFETLHGGEYNQVKFE